MLQSPSTAKCWPAVCLQLPTACCVECVALLPPWTHDCQFQCEFRRCQRCCCYLSTDQTKLNHSDRALGCCRVEFAQVSGKANSFRVSNGGWARDIAVAAGRNRVVVRLHGTVPRSHDVVHGTDLPAPVLAHHVPPASPTQSDAAYQQGLHIACCQSVEEHPRHCPPAQQSAPYPWPCLQKQQAHARRARLAARFCSRQGLLCFAGCRPVVPDCWTAPHAIRQVQGRNPPQVLTTARRGGVGVGWDRFKVGEVGWKGGSTGWCGAVNGQLTLLKNLDTTTTLGKQSPAPAHPIWAGCNKLKLRAHPTWAGVQQAQTAGPSYLGRVQQAQTECPSYLGRVQQAQTAGPSYLGRVQQAQTACTVWRLILEPGAAQHPLQVAAQAAAACGYVEYWGVRCRRQAAPATPRKHVVSSAGARGSACWRRRGMCVLCGQMLAVDMALARCVHGAAAPDCMVMRAAATRHLDTIVGPLPTCIEDAVECVS
eukprot:366366-Chlamydomonas_euryale.AAC.18